MKNSLSTSKKSLNNRQFKDKQIQAETKRFLLNLKTLCRLLHHQSQIVLGYCRTLQIRISYEN
jgi:hypothetical protein